MVVLLSETAESLGAQAKLEEVCPWGYALGMSILS